MNVLCTNDGCDYDNCAIGFVECDGDRTTGCEPVDEDNCGSCGAFCSDQIPNANPYCDPTTGTCGIANGCMSGYDDCDGNLDCGTDLSMDVNNCGECGHACDIPPKLDCQNSVCVDNS